MEKSEYYNPEKPICFQEQFDMLKSCSKDKDISAWNKFIKEKPAPIYLQNANMSEIHLEGAKLSYAHFEGADLRNAHFEGADLTNAYFESADLRYAHFEGADLTEAILNKAKLNEAHLEKDSNGKATTLYGAKFDGTNLTKTHLQGAKMPEADLRTAILKETHFEEANLFHAIFFNETQGKELFSVNFNGAILTLANFTNTYLSEVHFEQSSSGKQTRLRDAIFKGAGIGNTNFENADMNHVDLTGATFQKANLEGADLRYAILEGTSVYETTLKSTDFTGASVNDKTKILNCEIDEKTNLYVVKLDLIQIEPSLESALKTNARRIIWEKYFKKHSKSFLDKISTAPMRFFWWLSDYGSSSVRIGVSILIATLFFTDAYLVLAKVASGVFTLPDHQTLLIGSPFHDYIRVLCFAISTMVTLGFGGINIKIISGHNWLSTSAFGFVTINLITGYFFLSVLVTRFGILFQSQAPEQKVKKTNNTLLYFISLILFASSSYMLFCWKDITGFMNYAALVAILFMMPYCRFK